MNCSMPGAPALHDLLEFTKTHVHWFSDAIHSTMSSLVIPFSPCLQSFPASVSFPVSWLFATGGQSMQNSASASVLSISIHGWFPLGLTGLILQSKEIWRVFSNTTVQKHQFFSIQLSLWSNSHIHTQLRENHSLTIQNFVGKVMSLLFNMLSRFVIAFLPRSRHLLI